MSTLASEFSAHLVLTNGSGLEFGAVSSQKLCHFLLQKYFVLFETEMLIFVFNTKSLVNTYIYSEVIDIGNRECLNILLTPLVYQLKKRGIYYIIFDV